MNTVTKRQLNQQTSQVLAAVKPGRPVTVTERGTALWRIEAVAEPSAPIDRLRAAGRVIPAKEDPAPWTPAGPQRTPAEIDALLTEFREDDRL